MRDLPDFVGGYVGPALLEGKLVDTLVEHLKPTMIFFDPTTDLRDESSRFAASQCKRSGLLSKIGNQPVSERFMFQFNISTAPRMTNLCRNATRIALKA